MTKRNITSVEDLAGALVAGALVAGTLWRKSSYSGARGNCVAVAALPGGVAVCNSRSPHGPILTFTEAEFVAFVGGVHVGEFDR